MSITIVVLYCLSLLLFAVAVYAFFVSHTHQKSIYKRFFDQVTCEVNLGISATEMNGMRTAYKKSKNWTWVSRVCIIVSVILFIVAKTL